MYRTHQPIIADFAAQSPEHFFQVLSFVLLTINQHFEIVPALVADVQKHGLESKRVSRLQRRALCAMAYNAPYLHDVYQSIDDEQLIHELIYLPGLGIAKSAFVVQLLRTGSHVGCLDRHHLRAMGLKEKLFQGYRSLKEESLIQRIRAYCALCRASGGAEVLWDRWCTTLALLRPKSFKSAEDVSSLHVRCIVGE